tara:strand:- start:965 stop:1300 length:336 start_codon:yes stop_codon:yes gene_type:complete
MVKLTELEKKVLDEITEYSDIATDGFGLQGYILHSAFPMNKFRGVFSSLVKKGVCRFTYFDPEYNIGMEPMTEGYVTDEFQEEVEKFDPKIHSEEERYLIENTGYRLINIC